MRIILDTNFIISCVKQKIAFLDLIPEILLGVEMVVPEQVLKELERVKENKKLKIKDREAAELGLQLVERLNRIKLEKKFVDKGVLLWLKKNPEDYVATLDKELKKSVQKVIFIRGRKLDVID